MKAIWLWAVLLLLSVGLTPAAVSQNGSASWYGQAHRGRLMANGQKFDPDKLTAASWFYPLGTKLRVSLRDDARHSVVVLVTDRGPAKQLVNQGRLIDLSRSAFHRLAPLELGLVQVTIQPMPGAR